MRGTFLIWILSCSLMASAQQYGFRQYSRADGVAQSQVFALLNDHQGHLWLGTQGGGVNRWDGRKFQRYSVAEGLKHGKVHALFQDRRHDIWIGTNSGFSRFNGRQIRSWSFPLGLEANCLEIAETPHGQILLGSTKGLWTFDGDSLVRQGEEDWSVHDIAVSGDSIWLGTSTGLKLLLEDSLLTLPAGIRPSTPVECLAMSPNGQLYVAGYGSTLFILRDDRFEPFPLPFPDPGLVTDMDWNQEGDLWLSTQNQGMARWQRRDSSWTHWTRDEGLPSMYIKSLLIDQDDQVWLGTSGAGLCQYTGLPFVQFDQKSGLPEQAVYALEEDRECRIWMGNGLTLGYLEQEHFTDLRDSPAFRRTKYKSILEDSDGRLWVGTEGQGVALVTDTGFVWFDREQGLASNWIRSLAEGPDGAIWIGTASSGLSRISEYTDSTGSSWQVSSHSITTNGGQPRINQILFDPSGQLWVCTRDQWVYQQHSSGWTQWLTQVSQARDVRSMTFDEGGNLWLGTSDAGLIRVEFTEDTMRWEQILEELSSEVVYLIAFDEYGSLWVGSEQGMDRINLDEAGTIIDVTPFSNEEGFLGIETTQNASLKDREGRMWFGTINGVGRWQEGLQSRKPSPPYLVLEEIRLFYERLRNTPWDSLLTNWNEVSAPIVLPHTRNHLSFDLSGINLERAEEVLYQWKLIGSEPDWSPASQRQTATFSNLRPGEYTFVARAGFPEGSWSDSIRVKILIKPPFWQRWWFQAAIAACILIALWLMFRFRINQVKQRADRERQRVEIERDLIELEQKALRLQMNPHFIFNALNSIQALIIKEDPVTSRYYLSKFSRLMRQVLENSTFERVPLEQELQVLEDYLSLEKFSRGNSFDFIIEIAEAVDTDQDQIPPMMLQPFLENAIIHGIAHLTTRRGQVNLRISVQDHRLICTISDNGVGRKQAQRMKSQQAVAHKSMALTVTQERLSRLPGAAPELVIQDLLLADGTAAGTSVTMSLPTDT